MAIIAKLILMIVFSFIVFLLFLILTFLYSMENFTYILQAELGRYYYFSHFTEEESQIQRD